MTATLRIEFEDGTFWEQELDRAIALRVSPERKQSIEFRETVDKGGNRKWVMAFTEPVMQGMKFRSITITKNTP